MYIVLNYADKICSQPFRLPSGSCREVTIASVSPSAFYSLSDPHEVASGSDLVVACQGTEVDQSALQVAPDDEISVHRYM